jgi:hypothetical protein
VAACLGAGAAAVAAQSGDELYADYFGCWNCHGRDGEGGEGRPLRDTYLPLSFFLKELRLPTTTMPPFSPLLATDEELTLVYDWLGGADPVAVPAPLSLTLEAPERMAAGVAGELVLGWSNGADASTGGGAVPLRLTLFRGDASLVEGQAIEWVGPDGASASLVTDAYGEARLEPVEWMVAPSGDAEGARLRVALPAGGYVLVVEAVEEPTVLAAATAVLQVE